jgi:hypothetical protein
MIKRNNLSKIGLMFAILIFALASISASYAGLFDNINVFGTVTTSDDFVTTGGSSNTAWARMNDDPNDFTYDFPGQNWATYIIVEPTVDIQTFYLYAGQFYRVGELNIWKDNDHLYVQYDLDEGFEMEETQLHIATTLNDIPQTTGGNPGNPIPGQFDYKTEYDPFPQQDTYQIDWDSSWNNIDLYIAAHGVIWGIYE